MLKATEYESTGTVPMSTIRLLEPFDFKSMWDLGNKKTGKKLYSTYFRNRNIKYDSIDLNGRDGALKIDLQKPIGLLGLESRDLVMNLGTSEHILNQEALFRNIHELSHRKMLHQVPIEGSRPEHGYWGYTFSFFNYLAYLNHYIIEKQTYEGERKLVCILFYKTISDRVDKREFAWDKNLVRLLTRNKNGKGGVTYS